jgi:hypothetical protein
MVRLKVVKSASLSLLVVASIYAVTSACVEDVTEPCLQQTSLAEQRGLLDAATWRVSTINGQPADGWALPLPSSDYFYRGVIDFKTVRIIGDCDAPTHSFGYATAQYALRKANGSLSGNKKFVGQFKYDHASGALNLTAAGYELNGTVAGHTMTLPAAHQLFGTATVVLTR